MSVTVLSRLFRAAGQPRARSRARAAPAGARKAPRRRPQQAALSAPKRLVGQPAAAQAAQRRASSRGPGRPILRASPFPEVTDLICRLPLSTLFYLARGCSPWRPDAVMSTDGRENHSFPSIFTGRRGRTGPRQHVRGSTSLPTAAPDNPFPRSSAYVRLLRRTENSSQGPRRRLEVHLRRRHTACLRTRVILVPVQEY